MRTKEKILEAIDKAEKNLIKQIDDEIKIDEEIKEVAVVTANALESKMMVPMSIENRDFIVLAALNGPKENRLLTLVAREKSKIATPRATVIRANLEIDNRYTKRENLICALEALLGHITGRIKPEELD